jgi:hypothetical protein
VNVTDPTGLGGYGAALGHKNCNNPGAFGCGGGISLWQGLLILGAPLALGACVLGGCEYAATAAGLPVAISAVSAWITSVVGTALPTIENDAQQVIDDTSGETCPLPEITSAGAAGADAALVPSTQAFDPQAQALAQRIGGEAQVEFASGPSAGREFDAVSDEYVAQAKPANFTLSQAFRVQARATFQAAVDTGRIPYFQFNGPPNPGVLQTLGRYGAEYGVQPVIDLKPLGGG